MSHTDPMVTCDQCAQMRHWFPVQDKPLIAFMQNCYYEIRFNRGMPCKSVFIKHKGLYK